MATIRQRQNKSWQVIIRRKGFSQQSKVFNMREDAVRWARVIEAEFDKVAQSEVKGIQSAKQGNFYIRDVGEDYTDDRKIEKDVRVVTTISFYLDN